MMQDGSAFDRMTCGFARDFDPAYKPICSDAYPRSIGGEAGA